MVFGMDKASVDVDRGEDCGDVVRKNHRCSLNKTVVRASKELKGICRQTLSFDESCCIVCLRRLIARG